MDGGFTALLKKVAAAPNVAPPTAVGGTQRYELGRRLGSGAFGEVFVARDREYGGAVALKALRSLDAEWVYRFKGEFRNVADITHPNLARLYELFEEDGRWYLTMELVDGIPFDEHLARLPEQLEACFRQLASAIHALHRAGALHRDIKPSNALVEATGRVVLLDFGLAHGISAADADVVAGTPHFMAPEQWGGELSEATDWYAFGVMLYEALAGHSPFGDRASDLLAAKRRGPGPLERDPVGQPLFALATALMDPRPSARPGYEELIAALRAPTSSEAVSVDRLPFVGREPELAAMREAAVERSSRPVWLHVTGEPGIGKTALARAFLDWARQRGAAVYEGRCHETEFVPFKGFDAVVDMLCNDLQRRGEEEATQLLPQDGQALAEMFPALKRVGLQRVGPAGSHLRNPHARRAAAVGALRELLARIASERQVFVLLDDLQWAGDDTLELLSTLLQPPAPTLVVVTTARPGVDAVERALERARALAHVRCMGLPLGPLGRAEVSALVARHPGLGASSEDTWRESGGHPYLLSRMVGGGATGGLTANLRDSIAALSVDGRALLEVISLQARPLTQAAAFGAAGVDGWRADVVDELRRQRLARTSLVRPDAVIEPYHDRVREAVLSTLSDDERRERHRALAQYLEAHHRASPHSLAHHYQEAGSLDNARRWVRLAAQDAVRSLAFVRADELYGQAVELASAQDVVELRIEWADAMALAGRRAHAASIYLEAAAAAEREGHGEEAADLRTRAGEQWILAGHFPRGIQLIEKALAAEGVSFPRDNATAMALAFSVGGEVVARGLDFVPRREGELRLAELRHLDVLLSTARALSLTDLRATYASNLALREALRLGEPRRVQRALCFFVSGSAAHAPELPIFDDAIARAYALAEQEDDDVGRAWATVSEGIRHMQAGDVKRAWPVLSEAQRRFWSLDPPMTREAGGTRILLLACAAVEGVDVPFALRVVDSWLADADSRDDHFVACWLRLVGSRVKLIAGDVAGSARLSAMARAAWSELDDDLFASTLIHVDMSHRLYTEPETAHELGRELERKLSSMFVSVAPIARAGFYVFYGAAIAAAGAARCIDEREQVERIEGVIAVLAQDSFATPAIDSLRAHLAVRRGDRGRASQLMLSSARGWAERTQKLYEVSAMLRWAQLARDLAQVDLHRQALLELGVGDPDRYATVLAGPAPPP